WQNVLNGTNVQANRWGGGYINGFLIYDGAYGKRNYNALNVKVQKSFSHGLQFLFNYTYARSFELGPPGEVATFNQLGGTSTPMDSHNVARDYGPDPLDLPNVFVGSVVYTLPFGVGQRFLNSPRLVNKLVGGWQINAIATRESGFPISP